MNHIEGSMVAIVTPFRDGKIDVEAFKNLINFQIQNGTSVIVPCGTTGESATLSHDEHDEVIRLAVEHVNGRAKVLGGAGSNSTREALRLHKYCEKIGTDAALHITPYYIKPTQEGLYEHFKAIADSCGLPVVLYNVPGRTGVNLLPETVARLASHTNIIGIKEASGSLTQATEIIRSTPDDFYLYSGEDALTYSLYALGAKGAISVTCNVEPKRCSDQYLAIQENDYAKAKEIHYQLFDLHQAMFFETNPIPVKAALSMMGLIAEEYRLPMTKMSEGNRERLKKVLKDLKKIF